MISLTYKAAPIISLDSYSTLGRGIGGDPMIVYAMTDAAAARKGTLIYDEADLAFREIGNGVGACLALFLAIGLVVYAMRRGIRHWPHDPTVCGSLALAVFFAGSFIRNLISWGTIFAAARPEWDVDPWLQLWPWYGVSILLNVAGAAWAIWVFSPDLHRLSWFRSMHLWVDGYWRTILTVVVVGLSVVIPIVIHYGL